jgi:hypothetical protein
MITVSLRCAVSHPSIFCAAERKRRENAVTRRENVVTSTENVVTP